MKQASQTISKSVVILAFLFLLMTATSALPNAVATGSIDIQSPLDVTSIIEDGLGANLSLNKATYDAIKPKEIVMLRGFVLDQQTQVDLDLRQFSVYDSTTQFVVRTANGDSTVSPPDVILLRGNVVGQLNSSVYLGLSPYGCNGTIRINGATYWVASNRKNSDGLGRLQTTVCSQQALTPRPESEFECGTESWSVEAPLSVAVDSVLHGERLAQGMKYLVGAALEGSYGYYQFMGSDLNAAQTYIMEIFGAAVDVYERDLSTWLHLSYLQVNTAPDDYMTGDIIDWLYIFQNNWNTQMQHLTGRNFASLFTEGNPGTLGIKGATISGADLCNLSNAYSACVVEVGSFPWPDPSGSDWQDILIPMHEWGHIFGSPHTHCYVPPVDKCYNCQGCPYDDPAYPNCIKDANGSCESCGSDCFGSCYHGPVECTPGTLMSYCHRTFCGGISNVSPDFHPTVISHILNDLAGKTCLEQILTPPTYVDWAHSGTEDGTLTNPWNTVVEGLIGVPDDGTVFIKSGTYLENLTSSKRCVLRLWDASGIVVIGN